MRSTLSNGRAQVIHGMVTSSGCPCHSTLNDIDGISCEDDTSIAERYFLGAYGDWTSVKKAEPRAVLYDEQLKLVTPSIEGVPYYIETMDGRTFAGRSGVDGLLPRIDTDGESEYVVHWGDEALAKMEGDGA